MNHRLNVIQGHLVGSCNSSRAAEKVRGLEIKGSANRDCKDAPSNKVASPEEAAQLVKNGDWITVGELIGICVQEWRACSGLMCTFVDLLFYCIGVWMSMC